MKEKTVVILTGSELRHAFFRKYLALRPGLRVLMSCCEGTEKSLSNLVAAEDGEKDLRRRHLQARDCSERDFFSLFVENAEDRSNPVQVPKGAVNDRSMVERILEMSPDLLVAYGCSIIRGRLLEEYSGRLLNVHLGLSPRYRGSGTNFWPLVNGEPECVGATFMYMDAGVDTGEIIHQMRAEYCWGDTPHSVGNRLIMRMAGVYAELVENFDRLVRMPQPEVPEQTYYYRKKDFSEEAVGRLYENFRNGMVERYLEDRRRRDANCRLVVNPVLHGARREVEADGEGTCH